MSITASRNSISQAAKKWLNNFSDQVDFHRFQSGVMLFNKDHIVEMEIEPICFSATVLGSKDSKYKLHGDFILDGYFPDFKSLSITCSCPDDVPICKHGVCAICYLITYNEKFAKKSGKKSTNLLDTEKCEAILESFKEFFSPSDITVLNLPNESFWPFESSFNDAIKDIDSILANVIKEINSGSR
jgi:uncharacterized Zn finger protein